MKCKFCANNISGHVSILVLRGQLLLALPKTQRCFVTSRFICSTDRQLHFFLELMFHFSFFCLKINLFKILCEGKVWGSPAGWQPWAFDSQSSFWNNLISFIYGRFGFTTKAWKKWRKQTSKLSSGGSLWWSNHLALSWPTRLTIKKANDIRKSETCTLSHLSRQPWI